MAIPTLANYWSELWSCLCCWDDGPYDNTMDEKAAYFDGARSEPVRSKSAAARNVRPATFTQSAVSMPELLALKAPPPSPSESVTRSILMTPKSAARRTQRAASIRFTPELDDSMASDTPSDFSRLAGKQSVSQETGTPRRTLGEMSIAKLTSGLADGNRSCR